MVYSPRLPDWCGFLHSILGNVVFQLLSTDGFFLNRGIITILISTDSFISEHSSSKLTVGLSLKVYYFSFCMEKGLLCCIDAI